MGNFSKENSYEELNYQHYYQKALTIGKYFCHQIDLAEEVAQLTVIKLFLWKDKVECPDKWIYQVARNNSLQIINKQKKSAELILLLKRKQEQEQYSALVECPDLDKILHELPTEFLDTKDRELAIDFYCNGIDKSQLIEKYKLDDIKLSEKLYHIRQEVILYLKFTGDFTFIPKISGTRLNRNILNFIRKLKHCMETMDFTQLAPYADNIEELEKLKEAQKFVKLLNYELKHREKGKYSLFISYLTDKTFPFVIMFDIKLADWKKIRVISRLVVPKKVFRINQKLDGNDILLTKRTQNGNNLLSKAEADKILNKLDTTDLLKE